jgi:PPOX class probable F420-dependent enzyme
MDIAAVRDRFAELIGGARSPATGSRQGADQGEGGRERASEGNRDAAAVLVPFVSQHTVLLTTYRRNGTPVGTPVHIAVDGDRAFVRTWDATWKLKRIRNIHEVEVAPSTFRGVPTGPAIRAQARILAGEESVAAGRALAHKYPVMHGVLVPLVHRLRGSTTMHIELTPVRAGDGPTERGRAR